MVATARAGHRWAVGGLAVAAVIAGGFSGRAGLELSRVPACLAGGDLEVATIAEVADGDTFQLTDGRTVRLAGIEAPKRPLGWPPGEAWPLAEAARRGLEALVVDRPVAVALIADEPDRHDRWHGQVFVGDEGVWLQATLLAAGLARVRGFPTVGPCARALLGEERKARAGGLGLWASEDYQVRNAGDPSLLARKGLYELVEGRVASVGQGSYMTFVDFGRDYRRDFTIMIPPAVARRLAEAGVAIDALEGRRVRVRGTIEDSGGPAIRLLDSADLEMIDEEGDEGRG